MTDEPTLPPPDLPDDDPALHDPALAAAGETLRASVSGTEARDVALTVATRRARRRGFAVGALALVLVAVGVVALVSRGPEPSSQLAGGTTPSDAQLESFLDSLDDQPIDPTKVKLIASVKTFPSCDALIGDLRTVGAKHVGSRGFGDTSWGFMPVGAAVDEDKAAPALPATDADTGMGAGGEDTTLGTNVQVSGVDELDHVKAVGSLIYDLDGRGNLRITDADTSEVVGSVQVHAVVTGATVDRPTVPDVYEDAQSILVSGGHAAVFGTRTVTSDPVPGDPSATRGQTHYMTVTLLDVSDPAKPEVTDRVDIEGSLVSARLVKGEIRMVTTSNMADLGFVMPTTPNSVAKALEQNRRSVARSSVDDWIPTWQRKGEDAQRLVPCDRVNVPTTFAGVAMTSMVTFPIDTATFTPAGTSILAPGTTLYAGLDRVAISSGVWVDPIDRDRLRFDDWQTAIHEFTFAGAEAPTYEGSGIVDGSTIGQFAFGELGDALAVITAKGTPWSYDSSEAKVDLTVLSPDAKGGLATTAQLQDLAGGAGGVWAVRFIDGRILVSTGASGKRVQVVDVSDVTHPRSAGHVELTGETSYFHPLDGRRALLVGSRNERIGSADDYRYRPWVQAQLLDVSDADAPTVVSTWEVPWYSDEVGSDHHAFTWWPDRSLAMWGLSSMSNELRPTNHAAVLKVDGTIDDVALPEAQEPPEAEPSCPKVAVTDPEALEMLGPDGVLIRCAEKGLTTFDWPRYQCYPTGTLPMGRYAPGTSEDGSLFLCHRVAKPRVSRVLVVKGKPMLFTDQTIETLDPETFTSTRVVYHPTERTYGYAW